MQAPLFLRRETRPLTCCVTCKGQLGDQHGEPCGMTLLCVSSPRPLRAFTAPANEQAGCPLLDASSSPASLSLSIAGSTMPTVLVVLF